MTSALGGVLVTSAARKAPLLNAVRDAAHRLDAGAVIVAGDVDRDAPARYFADAFWTMAPISALGTDAVIEACRRFAVTAILPTRDGELAFWADRKPVLAQAGIAAIVSSPDAVRLCLDKLAFSQWAEREGLPVIPAGLTQQAFPDQKLVVKERFGAGSKSIGLGMDADAARKHAGTLTEPIFQPMIEGPEISIDAWMTARGGVHGLVLRRRDRVVNGESQISTTFRDRELERQAEQVLTRIGLSGPAVMQAIVTADGLAVIEVNARFGGASTTSIAAGLDTLYWSLFEAVRPGDAIPAFHRKPSEVKLVRAPQDVIVNDLDL